MGRRAFSRFPPWKKRREKALPETFQGGEARRAVKGKGGDVAKAHALQREEKKKLCFFSPMREKEKS